MSTPDFDWPECPEHSGALANVTNHGDGCEPGESVEVSCPFCGLSALADDPITALRCFEELGVGNSSKAELSLWRVFDGEEYHDVAAKSAIDAMNVMAEEWGEDQWDEYLETAGVYVALLNESEARAIVVKDEDGSHVSDLWTEWRVRPERCYLGSSIS